MTYEKPLPHPSKLTRPFWESVHRHQLSIQRCTECGKLTHPPMPACPNCLSMSHEWVPSSGEGTVYTFNISHRPPSPAFEADVPYAIALVELDDMPGIRIASNVIGCNPKEVHVGMKVKAVFEDATEEISVYKFVPR